MLAACDTQRAAAVDQLKVLGEKIGVPVFSEENKSPQEIAKDALKDAKEHGIDVLIVDTAGRQHVDEELMAQIEDIRSITQPDEVLFVVDSMMGQQAVDSAKTFDESIQITGFVLSKADSDARGGAALFLFPILPENDINSPERWRRIADFEVFHPDRIASRILGMGDVLSLIEKSADGADEEQQEGTGEETFKKQFTLEDYLQQMDQVSQMAVWKKLCPVCRCGGKLNDLQLTRDKLRARKAIIQSMTAKERQNPAIINASRRKRIAAGTATTVTDVNRLLKGFEQSKKPDEANEWKKRRFEHRNFLFK